MLQMALTGTSSPFEPTSSGHSAVFGWLHFLAADFANWQQCDLQLSAGLRHGSKVLIIHVVKHSVSDTTTVSSTTHLN